MRREAAPGRGTHREGPCSSSRRHFSQGHRLKHHCIFIFNISFAVGIFPLVRVSPLQPSMRARGGGLRSLVHGSKVHCAFPSVPISELRFQITGTKPPCHRDLS